MKDCNGFLNFCYFFVNLILFRIFFVKKEKKRKKTLGEKNCLTIKKEKLLFRNFGWKPEPTLCSEANHRLLWAAFPFCYEFSEISKMLSQRERFAIGAFCIGGVHFMCAHSDGIQGTEILRLTVIFALLYGTANALVCRCHNVIPPDIVFFWTLIFEPESCSHLLCEEGFFLFREFFS